MWGHKLELRCRVNFCNIPIKSKQQNSLLNVGAKPLLVCQVDKVSSIIVIWLEILGGA